ncbi:hypothetical protein TW81_08950 [Vibrio galatheae]|uniref:GGDEF domain-containing protein n=1 Tax=Vibrio galatheae TaxID=579748 RepID=A0A0F4NM30_9VIBR|nr:hypothetical protein [Vibrio galatheae]KJY83131.1 hypothetical protein TW81_08950 [Vibrio galatheae]
MIDEVVEELLWKYAQISALDLTENLSIGVTLIQPSLSMPQAALADSSLYLAKSSSKNAIYIHDLCENAGQISQPDGVKYLASARTCLRVESR